MEKIMEKIMGKNTKKQWQRPSIISELSINQTLGTLTKPGADTNGKS